MVRMETPNSVGDEAYYYSYKLYINFNFIVYEIYFIGIKTEHV